jgi:hypothetical protein
VRLDPREAVEVGRRQRGASAAARRSRIGGEDRQLAREGIGGRLADRVLERERGVDLGLGGEEVGGEGLVGGVDCGEAEERLAPRAGRLGAAAADQRVGAAHRGDVEAGPALVVVRRGSAVQSSHVHCPLGGFTSRRRAMRRARAPRL